MLKKTMNSWNKFWFEKISPYPISAFRIAFGIYLFIYFLWSLPYVGLLYSNLGVYSPFLIPDIAPSLPLAWAIYLLTLALIAAFTLGYRTKIITPLLFGLFLYYFFLNFAVKNCSYDRLIIIFFSILCFADLEGAWTISKSEDSSPRPVSAWPTRLLAFQVAIFYFGTGVYKAFTPYWHTGQILKMTLLSNWGTPAAFWLIKLNLPMWLYDCFTWALIAFELSVGFLLYVLKVQKYVFTLGILFHTSVWIFLGIPQFMICPMTYLLFVPPSELEALSQYLKKFFLERKLAKSSSKEPMPSPNT